MAVSRVCVLISLTVAISNAVNISENGRNIRRDSWYWGLVEDNQRNATAVPGQELGFPARGAVQINAVTVQTTTPVHEEGAMPNFYKPGRRISETKCYEYAWQIRNLEELIIQREKIFAAYSTQTVGLRFRRDMFVAGGRSALYREYPHMAAIGWRGQRTWIFKCGGTLISSRFVLTAAHCTKYTKRGVVLVPKIVRLGATNILDVPNDKVHDEYITSIIVPPSYSALQKYNDIALLQLSRDVEFSETIQPACLWSSFDTSSIVTATITGWGEEGSRNTPSSSLQTANVDIINSTTCDGLLRRYCNRRWCGLQSTQLCAGKLNGGVDTCLGDSGGPLHTSIPVTSALGSMHFVVGVTSFGFGHCARARSPGIYTRVAAFADWIESVVWS